MPLKKLHRIMLLWFRLHGLISVPNGVQSKILSAVSLSLALTTPTVIVAPAYAAELTEWRFDPETRQLELLVPGGTTPNYFLLAQPARVVLDLPNTVVDRVLEEQSFPGVVRSIRVSQFQPNLTRIVIELAPDAELSPSQVELRQISAPNVSGHERWVIRPLLVGDSPVATIEPVPTIPAPEGVNEPSDSVEGVTFEANTGSPEASAESSSVVNSSDERVEDEVNQPTDDESEVEVSEVSVATSQSGSRESDEELPPLEPGAFEIPVEIPPPLPDVETSPLLGAIASEPEAQSSQPNEGANLPLPVAIAPPATDDSDHLEASESSNSESSNLGDDARNEEPDALSTEDAATAIPDLQATTANEPRDNPEISSVESDSSESDSSSNGSSANATMRITARTPEELQQALAEALPPGTEISIVDSNDDRSDSNAGYNDDPLPESSQSSPVQSVPLEPEAGQPENIQSGENSDGETATDLDASLTAVDASTLLDGSEPVEQSLTQDNTPGATLESEAVESEAASTSEGTTDLSPEQQRVSIIETPVNETLNESRLENESEEPSEPIEIEPIETDDDFVQDDLRRDGSEYSASERSDVADFPSPYENDASAVSATSIARASDSSMSPTSDGQPIDVQPPSSVEHEDFSEPSTLPAGTSQESLGRSSDRQLIVAAQPGAMIPSGTVLRLRYPRLTPTLLQKGIAWQDVLLLEQTLFDRSGNVIAPEGTQIIGRFEIAPQQIRFVTQAIALDGRNIPLQAVSGWVSVSADSQAVVIRPNQIVNVRLAEHFDR